MRISSVTAYLLKIPFTGAFAHARHWRSATDTIVLAITSSAGATGWGEILPRDYLTGETISGVLSREVPRIARLWLRRNFSTWDEVVAALRGEQYQARNLATLAGWELALLDVAGHEFGVVAADILGMDHGAELPAGAVIGFEVPTEGLEKACRLLLIRGTRFLKIKIGRSDDVARLETVSRVLGRDFPLRLDANGAFQSRDAISLLRRVRNLNIKSIEQPVAASDLNGMRRVRESTGVAVVADEALCSPADAQSIIAARAADIFNIRVAKCGGWMLSQRMVRLAQENGLKCELGTLVGETGILSTASEAFGRRVRAFDFLEGKGQNVRLLVQDIVEPETAPSAPGLRIRILNERLRRWTTFTSTISEVCQGVTA